METKNKLVSQGYYKINSDAIRSNIANCDVDLMINCCGEAVIRSEWAHGEVRKRNDFYLIYSLGSDIVGEVDGVSVTIGSGDAICISPGTGYSLGSRLPFDEWTHYFWIHFTGSEAERTVLRSGLTPGKVYSVGRCDDVFPFYEKLFSEFRALGTNFEYDAAVQLRYILYIFGKATRKNAVSRLEKSIKYIHTHLCYSITVESLAAMEYLGVSRYREVFKSVTGISPIEYVTRLRIERAKDLLSQNNASIEEVGEAVGYANRYYFHRLFKKYTGQTPGEYRKESKR